jgi:hypothetical protein
MSWLNRHLTEAIYGKDHPYGRNALPQVYQAITVEDMREHHRQFLLHWQNGMIFFPESYDEEILKVSNKCWGPGGQ